MARKRRFRGIIADRAKRQAGGSPEENDWQTTYGDLMSLLLVFFVLFYVFSVTGQLPLLSEALEAYQRHTTHSQSVLQKPEGQAQPRGGERVITIPSQVLFDLGKADIKPAALPYLKNAVDTLKQILQNQPNAQVRIEGYTDNIPIHNWRYRNNWELSAARAIAVVQFLIDDYQFPPEKLQAMGYGEYNPVAPNDTPANRQKNRRVEIKVVAPPSSQTQVTFHSEEEIKRRRQEDAQRATGKLLGKESGK